MTSDTKSLRPATESTFRQQADSAYRRKDTTRLEDLSKDRNPQHSAYAQFYLGTLHLNRQDFGAAQDCLAKALKNAPSWPEARYNLAFALAGLGRRGEAVDALLQAERLFRQAQADDERDGGLFGRLFVYRGLLRLEIAGSVSEQDEGIYDLSRGISYLARVADKAWAMDMVEMVASKLQEAVAARQRQAFFSGTPGVTGAAPPTATTTRPE